LPASKHKKGLPAHEISSGNVFADLGIANSEEALAKAKIARVICNLVESRRITQTQLAARLEVDQPAVSRLLRGVLREFSLGRLLLFLMRLGNVEIAIRN
jgi:predicted XRE-type DNA-binding protein